MSRAAVCRSHTESRPSGSIIRPVGWADGGWDAVLERWERQLVAMQGGHDPGLRPALILAAVEQRGFQTRLNQPGLLWQVVALERTA